MPSSFVSEDAGAGVVDPKLNPPVVDLDSSFLSEDDDGAPKVNPPVGLASSFFSDAAEGVDPNVNPPLAGLLESSFLSDDDDGAPKVNPPVAGLASFSAEGVVPKVNPPVSGLKSCFLSDDVDAPKAMLLPETTEKPLSFFSASFEPVLAFASSLGFGASASLPFGASQERQLASS
jgi:hypothetical protein